MWKWDRLQRWVLEEAESARWYRDLTNAVHEHAEGRSALWRDPNLRTARDFAEADGWNGSWAAQYRPGGDPSFAQAHAFCSASRNRQTRDHWVWGGALALIAVASLAAVYFWGQAQIERKAKEDAQTARDYRATGERKRATGEAIGSQRDAEL